MFTTEELKRTILAESLTKTSEKLLFKIYGAITRFWRNLINKIGKETVAVETSESFQVKAHNNAKLKIWQYCKLKNSKCWKITPLGKSLLI